MVDRKKLHAFLAEPLRRMDCLHEVSWILDFVESRKHPDHDSALQDCEEILARKEEGEPLGYIFGAWSFRGHEFFVGPGVLIPRPETEELVEAVLLSLENSRSILKKIFEQTFRVLDLGAGSGCLGIGFVMDLLSDIAGENLDSNKISRNFHLTLVESSPAALPILHRNVAAFREKLKNTTVEIVDKDWNTVKFENFDLILSNPPYVSPAEYEGLHPSVKNFEPKSALLAVDPWQPYREVFDIAGRVLNTNGWVFVEIGPAQGEELQILLTQDSRFNDVRTLRDITKRPRFVSARKVRD